jgi:putative ABC transport system permease protein
MVADAVSAVGRFIDERNNRSRGLKLYPVGLQADLTAPIRPALFALGLAGLFLLLVLTVNLSSLLLARAAEREREFAVSRAVGANGIAVVRAMLIEGSLLGFLGGSIGALIGVWGSRVLVALAPLDLPRREEIALDWSIAAIVIAVGVALGLAAASIPAAWAARISLASLMATSAVRGASAPGRMRRGMIVVQVALSLVMLSAGGLVVRSFETLLRADPGFRSDGVLTFMVAVGPRLFPKASDALTSQDRVEAGLHDIAGITAVSAASALPLSASASQMRLVVPGAAGNTGDADRDRPTVDIISARPGYVDAMGIQLVAGRDFDTRREEIREALIDQQLARQFFPSGGAVGATIPMGDSTLRIAGVMKQARLYDLHQDGRGQIFIPPDDRDPYTPFFVVRTKRDPETLIRQVQAMIRQIDPRIPMSSFRTMDEIVTDALRQQRISAVLIAGSALGALLLVGVGLFGVVSGSVTRRRGELAVRLALGATHRRVLGLVIGEGAQLIGMGLLIGLPGVYVSGQAIRSVLVGVSPFDAPTLSGVAIGMAGVALFVCYLAARRVISIEPSRALRDA